MPGTKHAAILSAFSILERQKPSTAILNQFRSTVYTAGVGDAERPYEFTAAGRAGQPDIAS
jgi:hypothetical protein